MKVKYLGTAAYEGVPALFCDCKNCELAIKNGKKDLRSRSQALIDDRLLIDFPADAYYHAGKYNLRLSGIKNLLITHSHSDHLYPSDLTARGKSYAHLKDDEILNIFAGKSGCDKISAVCARTIDEGRLKLNEVKPFEEFYADGYRVLPLKASHDEETSPFIYSISKGGKTMLYAHDTGVFCEETWTNLEKDGKKFDFVSLDGTMFRAKFAFHGHMSYEENVQTAEDLKQRGLADKNTIICLAHFSHNHYLVHDEMQKAVKDSGFLISYDGMDVDF